VNLTTSVVAQVNGTVLAVFGAKGIRPVFCDLDRVTHQPDPALAYRR
jgi:hypothetical protein